MKHTTLPYLEAHGFGQMLKDYFDHDIRELSAPVALRGQAKRNACVKSGKERRIQILAPISGAHHYALALWAKSVQLA